MNQIRLVHQETTAQQFPTYQDIKKDLEKLMIVQA